MIMMEEVEVAEQNRGIRRSIWDNELAELATSRSVVSAHSSFRIVFGSSQGLQEAIGRWAAPQIFPSGFLLSLSKDLNGSYGAFNHQTSDARPVGQSAWYSFKIKQVSMYGRAAHLTYVWQQIVVFTTFDPKRNRFLVLCLDCPKSTRISVQENFQTLGSSRLASWHAIFLEAIKDLYDSSVWSLRDCVRNAECTRTSDYATRNFQPDFVYLHEAARHIIHSNETLDVAIDTVKRIQQRCRSASTERSLAATIKEYDEDMDSRISTVEKDIEAIKRRSESLKERLQNEINLAFNLVAQHDSQIIVRMGESSRQDNKNMQSIAIVGLIYLPATFVSGLFGMNFFQFDGGFNEQKWRVSDKFWIYWAVTVPLTLTTVCIWVVAFHGDGLRRRLRRNGKDSGAGGRKM